MKEAAWIAHRRVRQNPTGRLFCLPFAGGGASTYRTWPDLFGQEIEVCPVQLPGRENRIREAPLADMEELVAQLVEALTPLMDLPWVVFGHSFGATVGFELARAADRPPEALLVSARRGPQVASLEPPLHDLPEPEFRARLAGFAGTPEAVLADDELMELLGPMLRADFALNDTYRHRLEPRLACPVHVWGGHDDAAVPLSHLEAWREVTVGAFSLSRLPGNHFTLLESPELHDGIREVMREVSSRT